MKTLPCGHKLEIDCGLPVEKYADKNKCEVPCSEILECDHECPNKCGDCF